MRIFIYEYMTACGLGQSPASPEHGMHREGLAMREAIAEDFSRVSDVNVSVFPESKSSNEEELFLEQVHVSDWSLLIAPELENSLLELAQLAEQAGGQLLGPSSEAIRLTTDKLALFQHWSAHKIPTPATTDREPTACEAFPIVWKPRDGAGSTMTFLLNSSQDVYRAQAVVKRERDLGPMILQEFIAGQAASLAFLCGPKGNVPLLPASQLLSVDGRFHYRGGEIPLTSPLRERAVELGQRAVDCIPHLKGYVGVDLVLGAARDGSRDYAIEINPRLTTSYLGLRKLAEFNIAEAMLRAATGTAQIPLLWKAEQLRFEIS